MDKEPQWATYPWGHKELDVTEVTEYMHMHAHTRTYI